MTIASAASDLATSISTYGTIVRNKIMDVDDKSSYDLYNFINGQIVQDEVVWRVPVLRKFVTPADFAGSIARCVNPATETAVAFAISKNSVGVGNIIFDKGSEIGEFVSNTSDPITWNVGDIYAINHISGPVVDPTFSDISVGILGNPF